MPSPTSALQREAVRYGSGVLGLPSQYNVLINGVRKALGLSVETNSNLSKMAASAHQAISVSDVSAIRSSIDNRFNPTNCYAIATGVWRPSWTRLRLEEGSNWRTKSWIALP